MSEDNNICCLRHVLILQSSFLIHQTRGDTLLSNVANVGGKIAEVRQTQSYSKVCKSVIVLFRIMLDLLWIYFVDVVAGLTRCVKFEVYRLQLIFFYQFQVKECVDDVKKVCKDVVETQCRKGENIECKEELQKECKTIYNNVCKNDKKKVCKTVYKEQCTPTYKPSYGAPANNCHKVPEEVCEYKTQKVCQKVPENKCENKKVTKCVKIPEEICRDVPVPHCKSVPTKTAVPRIVKVWNFCKQVKHSLQSLLF